MDAQNLALCLAPVLVRSHDLNRDVRHCRVASPSAAAASEPTTLAALLVVMISRYHEVMDVDPAHGLDDTSEISSTSVNPTSHLSRHGDPFFVSSPASAPASPRTTPASRWPTSLSDSSLSTTPQQRGITAARSTTTSGSSPSSVRHSLTLMKGTGSKGGSTTRPSPTRAAAAEVRQSPVSVMGLFDGEPHAGEQGSPVRRGS